MRRASASSNDAIAQLRQAEQKILLLAGEDAEGKPLAKPFDHVPLGGDRPDALLLRASRIPQREFGCPLEDAAVVIPSSG